MCANFKPIKKIHANQLDLFEPTFEYKMDIFPSDDCPLILSNENELEWRKAKFGMLPLMPKKSHSNMQLIMPEQRQYNKSALLNMLG